MPPELAAETVRYADAAIKDGSFLLYRSAVTMGREWEPDLARVTVPSMVFRGALDPACPIEFGHELGRAMRAEQVVELDCNHWTVLQRPAEVAALLEAHWRRHPSW